MIEKLDTLNREYDVLERSLGDPALLSDQTRYRETMQRYSELQTIVRAYEQYKDILGSLSNAEEALADPEVLLPLGAARPGREHDVVEVQPPQLLPGDVVGHHDGRDTAHLGAELVEVEGERVVVVDEERPHGDAADATRGAGPMAQLPEPFARSSASRRYTSGMPTWRKTSKPRSGKASFTRSTAASTASSLTGSVGLPARTSSITFSR